MFEGRDLCFATAAPSGPCSDPWAPPGGWGLPGWMAGLLCFCALISCGAVKQVPWVDSENA